MAYDTNSLVTAFPRVGAAEGPGDNTGGYSGALHIYRSADDIATVIAAGYIDDGNEKFIQVNDMVLVIDDNTPTIDLCLVTVVAANGDVTLINGT
jgi:hypothetical protein